LAWAGALSGICWSCKVEHERDLVGCFKSNHVHIEQCFYVHLILLLGVIYPSILVNEKRGQKSMSFILEPQIAVLAGLTRQFRTAKRMIFIQREGFSELL
jgi:hypothetical protein